MKTKTITATIHNTQNETVRIRIPAEQADETTAGHRQIGTGIVRIGRHVGRRWGVVHNYSIWAKRDGTVYGDEYEAYDLTNREDRADFALVLASSHYTDTETGRGDVGALDLVEGSREPRPVTPEEVEWLVDHDYDRGDAEVASVCAETPAGAKLFCVPHAGYAIEGETGDGFADLDLEDAIRTWR